MEERGLKDDVFRSYLVDGARFSGRMEFPALTANAAIPSSLTEFRRLKKPNADNQYIHFYLHDRKYESINRNPNQYLSWFRRFAGIIGFDFSSHAECPLYKQVECFGRNRELSFWFARQGISVIPNVRWGNKETFSWCFDGLPKRSTVAVSTLGCTGNMFDRRLFSDGFLEMMARLEPDTIVVYGTKSERLFPPLFVYKSRLVFFESHFKVSHRKEAD